LVIGGKIDRADIPGLCECVRVSLESGDVDLVVCEVGALVDPDAVAVDALARLQLTARRCGAEIRIGHTCDGLRDLLAFMGLSDVVSLGEALTLGPGRKTEQRKQAGGVEEEGDPGDPTA
jgi:ABC-type transporter Mla MlaB component